MNEFVFSRLVREEVHLGYRRAERIVNLAGNTATLRVQLCQGHGGLRKTEILRIGMCKIAEDDSEEDDEDEY